MPAFRMTIELAGMADIDPIEEIDLEGDDDSVELIIERGDDSILMETDFETARAVLDKLEEMGLSNHEGLKDYEYSRE